MSEEVWYYADGERQKGPVSADDLKRLVDRGNLKPTDLVWQPGMTDWVAAKTIAGLVPEELLDVPLEELGGDSLHSEFGDEARRKRRRRRRPAFQWNLAGLELSGGRHGKLLAWIGLLLLVFGRGCDSLGSKYSLRQQVMPDVAKAEFESGVSRQRSALQTKIFELRRQVSLTKADEQSLIVLEQQLQKLEREYTDTKNRLSQTTWLQLEFDSKSAVFRHVAWQPLYGLCELAGALLLATGLLAIAFSGETIERWGCWILLGVLLFIVCGWDGRMLS